MENKYYIPDISEFHVGFEYEIIYDDEIMLWKFNETDMEQVFSCETENLLGGLIWKLIHNKIRVKCLDKEDIESFGFEQQSLPYQYKKDWYRLIERCKENQYIIEDGRYQDQIFLGTIKNKSELRKLLQQLGIC